MKLIVAVFLSLFLCGCSWIGNEVEKQDAKKVMKATMASQKCVEEGKSQYCAEK